jgi:hypothetical protein
MFDEIDGTAPTKKENQDTGSWEDVEEASDPEGPPEKQTEKEKATPTIKLNYHCLKQLDDEENNANAFINTQEMRSNEFIL